MTYMASLFLIILSTLTNTSISKPANIHSILHKWTPISLNIKFISPPSSPILKHMQTNIEYTIQNLTKYIMIHPLQHYVYNQPIPAHCQYLIHLNKAIETHISLHESEIIVYIISNDNDIQCPSNIQHNPFHSESCISTANHRLLFGIINLCNNINNEYINHIKYNLYKLFNTNITNLFFDSSIYSIQYPLHNHNRHLLSPITELSAQNKAEILTEINMFRSEGALGKIQLGTVLWDLMQSSRMEAYIWDDALMDSAMIKASTCNINIPSSNATLSHQYINNPSRRIPIIDPDMTLVGEIVYNATQSINFNDAIDEALDAWRQDCKYLNYFQMGCLNTAPSIQHCDNCRRLLAETARYIGCGFNKCSRESIAVVCHIYYSTNINNLDFPIPGFVPYFSPSNGGDQCDNCPDDRNNCDVNEGLCRGCPSLNYEACQYANNGAGKFCPPLPPDLNCSESGITTAVPTLSPTLAPTFTPTNNIGVLDIADLLNNVINLKRRRVAKGQVINFPNSRVGVRATNMEKLIWDESLSITATDISLQCNNIYTNRSILGGLYKDTLDSMGMNARVIVSNDSDNILVGETMYIIEDWIDANDAALQAFNAWQDECDLFNFASNCNGSNTDPLLCRNCLQLIWSKSRYIGCGLSGCPVVYPDIKYNAILFVCHWYWGADLFDFSGNTNWLLPYNPGGSDDFCMDLPFSIAGCNDTERNSCDDGLCDGCPHDNFHQCTTSIAFNQQQFGYEGCKLQPIQTTCSDGVTPTFSPTTAPTFTEPDLDNVLGIANDFRSQIGSNGVPASNMQSFIWHEPLAQSAYCTANTCNITPTNQNELRRRFQQSTTLDVSDDINNIIIGEINFISIDWINPETSLIEALTYWFNQCNENHFIFGVGCCKGQCSIFNCNKCLQMIWAKTRYIGCSYDSCRNIRGENGIMQHDALYVVCHFYFGANITETNGLEPYQVGSPCSNCPIDRDICDLNTCSGCPANNWELCEISEPNTCNVSVPVPPDCIESGIPSPQHPEYTQCPSLLPTLIPTISPTLSPTYSPTNIPTDSVTNNPTPSPTYNPTPSPTYNPTRSPINSPTYNPTPAPTNDPTNLPTMSPTDTPTNDPTISPINSPTNNPSKFPTDIPSISPTKNPTYNPTYSPSYNPTVSPSIDPTNNPSKIPSISPSISPSKIPTNTPSISPSIIPTNSPIKSPTNNPTKSPTNIPSTIPTNNPTISPSQIPSFIPSISPSIIPTISPSYEPTNIPSILPSITPTNIPTISPSFQPTNIPSIPPTILPSFTPSNLPSISPTINPITRPTFSPSNAPTHSPHFIPTTHIPSTNPTHTPSIPPTSNTNTPSIYPTINPTNTPSISPSHIPTNIPTQTPTHIPTTNTPTNIPSIFTITPTITPSTNPSISPTHSPITINPTITPSNTPIFTINPTISPTTIPTVPPSLSPTTSTNVPSPSHAPEPPTTTTTNTPSHIPTNIPTKTPTHTPTTFIPTNIPSTFTSNNPSISPTNPTINPTKQPSKSPTTTTTNTPSISPSHNPTTNIPSRNPSISPTHSIITINPTITPTNTPIVTITPTISPSTNPTISPSINPNKEPSKSPTTIPTITPSISPTVISLSPTTTTTNTPSISPSIYPITSPTYPPPPTITTTIIPSTHPTTSPTDAPTPLPTTFPTDSHTPLPTIYPTHTPTHNPISTSTTTHQPTPSPTTAPTTFPIEFPTTWPTKSPTHRPTSGWLRRSYSARTTKNTHDFLVAVDVCFSTNDNHNSKYPKYGTFVVPYSGTIHGITLTYSSGGIYENAQAVKANWGINEMINLFCIHITNDKLQVLYPNHHTNGYNPHCNNITTIPQYLPFSHYIKDDTMYCLNKQSITNYKLHFIDDTDHKKLVHVEAGQVLRIYWDNILFENENHFNDDELNGKLCVDVMLYYYHISDHRSTKRHKSSDTNVYKQTSVKPILYSSSSYNHKFYKKNKKYSPKKFHWYWMQRYQSS